MADLKQQLKQQLAEGKVSISSDSLKRAEDSQAEPVLDKPTVAEAPKIEEVDPLMAAGAVINTLPGAMDGTDSKDAAAGPIDTTIFATKVDITPEDKEAFLQAVISGNRFTLPFSLFNGRLTGVFRSRSQKESQAVTTQLTREWREKPNGFTAVDYSFRIRTMLLTAQVQSLNGTELPPLSPPYTPTLDKDGKTIHEPGWIMQTEFWEGKDEAVISALYKELQIFECKYWTMTNSATDQNFWQPAGSTSV